MKKASRKNRKWILVIVLFVLVGVAGMVITVLDFNKNSSDRYVSMNIYFTYPNIAKNKMPNGEVFTIEAILNDDIIESALKKNQLEMDYTAAKMRKSLVVSGVYSSDVIDKVKQYDSVYDFSDSREVLANNSFTTVYNIKLYDDYDSSTSDEEMKKIIKALAESYKEYFYSEYIYNYDKELELSLFNIEDKDYRQQVSCLYGKINLINGYAQKLYSEESNYRYNGVSFKDISIKLHDVTTNTLDNIEALVDMKSYSKNPGRLRSLYQYRIDLLENEEKQYRDSLDEVNKLLEAYQMDDILYIGSGDSVIKVDSNSVETYEALMTKKIELNDKLINTSAEIAAQKMYLTDITKAEYSVEEIATFESGVADAAARINAIEDEFVELLAHYNEFVLSADGVSIGKVNIQSPSVFSINFIIRYIKISGPMFVILFIILSGRMVFVEIKRSKVIVR